MKARTLWLSLAVLSLTACPKEDDETEEDTKGAATTAAPAPPPPPAQTASTTIATATPPANRPAIEAKVKAELDGKTPESTAGSTLSVAGAKVAYTAPTGWTVSAGLAKSADGKNQFTSLALPAAGDPIAVRDAAVTALGYSDCEWGNNESIKMGKDGLATQAADGVCMSGGKPVRTAFAQPEGTDSVAVGGWSTDGGNAAEVFGVFKTVRKAAGGTGGDPTGIGACCSAIRQNAKSAPLQNQGAMIAAAAACDALRNNPQGKAALAGVRSMLGANAPPACR